MFKVFIKRQNDMEFVLSGDIKTYLVEVVSKLIANNPSDYKSGELFFVGRNLKLLGKFAIDGSYSDWGI